MCHKRKLRDTVLIQNDVKTRAVCYKKRQKSPNEETGFGNRGPQEALSDTKLILND